MGKSFSSRSNGGEKGNDFVVPLEMPSLITNDLRMQMRNLGYETLYYWRVVCKNAGGETVGAVWNFTIETLPPVNINTLYQRGAKLELIWDPISGATNYQVFITTNLMNGFHELDTCVTNRFIDSNSADSPCRFYRVKTTVNGL